MQAARMTVAWLAALAIGAPVALAQSLGTTDPARQRAEDLAEAASRQFGEVMKEERVAQAQSKPPAAPSPGQAAGDDPWTATLRWLEYSNREYRSIVRKLARGSGAETAPVPPPPPATAKPAPHLFPRRGGCDPQSENGALLCRLLAAICRPVARLHCWPNAGAGVYLCPDGTYE